MKKIVLSILGLCTVGIVAAQSVDAQTQIDSLNNRIAKLEKRSAVWDKLKPAFKFSGYIQAGYDYLWDDEATTTSTFHLRRARVSLQGDIYKGAKGAKASYRLQLDFCRTPTVVDLWMKYQPINAFGIQVGQFKLPISIENTDYNAVKLEFINYAQVVQRLARLGSSDMTGIGSTGRDIGAMLYGGFIKKDGFSVINYEVGVFNGAGINTKDNNKSKDIAARMTIQPLKRLKIAGYYQYGEGNITSALVKKYAGIGKTGANVAYSRYGGGADFSNDFLFARAEYIGGKTGDLLSQGAYAQVGYKFLQKCSAGVRLDYFDEDTKASGHQINYVAALSYYPFKFLRLQAEYARQQYYNLQGSKNGNCIYLMATAIF